MGEGIILIELSLGASCFKIGLVRTTPYPHPHLLGSDSALKVSLCSFMAKLTKISFTYESDVSGERLGGKGRELFSMCMKIDELLKGKSSVICSWICQSITINSTLEIHWKYSTN